MTGTGRVVSVGNAVADLVAAVPGLPAAGADVAASDWLLAVGGAGANALIAARRQGVAAVYAGAVGTGPFGELVRDTFAAERVDVVHAPMADRDTGWVVALVEPHGERSFVTTVGAEAELSERMLARVLLESGDVLHVSGYGLANEPSGTALEAWVPTIPPGVTVVVDPGPVAAALPSSRVEPVLARADWWSGSEAEALAATGAGDADAAADVLAARGLCVVVRLGDRGCLVHDGVAARHVAPFPVSAVDTNGAGDAHVGVFMAGLAAGLEPAEAARRANAAAALASTRRGPATAPTAAELTAFLGAG